MRPGKKRTAPRQTEMPFWDHVEALRRHLLIALIALAVATFGSFLFAQEIISLLAEPVGSLDALQSIEVTENVSVFMRVSLLSGVAIAMPVILYELLAFIMPGLKDNERRWVILAVVFGTLLFLAGAAFSYFFMIPASLSFLLDFLGVATKPRLSSYINFITNLIFWMGIAFQFPILVFALAKLGIVSVRALAKGWRYALVLIAVMAAMITPTVDPVNMALLMAPLFLLYLLSVLLAALAVRDKKRSQTQEDNRNE